MKTLVIILLASFISSTVFADYTVLPIGKGSEAQFTGFLIDPPTEQKFRLMSDQLDYQTHLAVSLDQLNKTYVQNQQVMQTRLDSQMKEIDSLSSEVARRDSIWGKIGMFTLGAIVTGFIAYGVSRTTK